MDVFLQLEDDWALDQPFAYGQLDDIDVGEAQCGLPGIGTKPETLADTPMEGLLDLSSSPSDGSFGADWMEQADFAFPEASFLCLPLSLDEDFDFKPSSTIITTDGPSPGVESKEGLESLDHVLANEFLHSLHKASLKLDTPPSSPLTPQVQATPEIVLDADTDHLGLQVLNSGNIEFVQPPVKQVTPEIILDADTDHSTLDADTDHSTLQVLARGNIEFMQSPLSPDDVENVLSSASSPAPTPSPTPSSPATVDASILYSEGGSWSVSSSDLYKVVENTDKSRSTPYSRPPKASKSNSKSKGRKLTASISPSPTELELELMSKKDRKKLQNKNAAIRYRMKKKQESDEKRSEVDDLEAINTSLHEKCDELQREVKCLKDLINEIRKAKGQPPLPLTQHSLIGHKK